MPVPYLMRDGVKIAIFKKPDLPPFGAFANTTSVSPTGVGSYPITQTYKVHGQSHTVQWPSSEHAFHAQKIIFLKNKLPANHPAQKTLSQMLTDIQNTKEEYNPRKHYDSLVNNALPALNAQGLNLNSKFDFDKLCESDYHSTKNPTGGKRTIEFMRTVVRLKLEQHPDLRKLAMECAREGVLPIEVSQYDVNWASGPNGEGQNLLGQIVYEEGARLLQAQGEIPAFTDPTAEYQKISQGNKTHNSLVSLLNPKSSPGWHIPVAPAPTPTQTSSNEMKPFKSDPMLYQTPREQAEAIWKEQVEPLLKQGKSVGLIYAANNDQAQGLRAGYKNGHITGVIGGSGQAPVYAEIAKMIEQRKLQDKVHILPVSTSMHGGDNTSPANKVGLEQIDRDLANIASHKASGWEIRGIANKSGGYAIGGGASAGWFDPNNASIIQHPDGTYTQTVGGTSGLSQGQYVQQQLDLIATQPIPTWPANLQQAATILPFQVVHGSSHYNKWQVFHDQHPEETAKVDVDGSLFTLKEVEKSLQHGEIPQINGKGSCLDHFVLDGKDNAQKIEASNLLAIYSVKSVMGSLATQVKIDMVDSNNPTPNHLHAMKIKFNSQEEAQAFADKLFKEHGIHSHTFGPGIQKTPQNGAIYLTPEDLEKISQNTKMSNTPGTGMTAFNIKVHEYEQQKELSEDVHHGMGLSSPH